MRNLRRALFIPPFILFLATAALASSFAGRVIGVTDGDTIKVLNAGREVKVRLYGIDAPEKRQAFGARAKQYASDLSFGREVVVQEVARDRYGRVIAWITLRGGRRLNTEMVRAGFAWWYRRYAEADHELEEHEREARVAHRGLWSDPQPAPPWEFRRQERQRTKSRPTMPDEWSDGRR